MAYENHVTHRKQIFCSTHRKNDDIPGRRPFLLHSGDLPLTQLSTELARIRAMSPQSPFTDVPDAIEEIRAGRMIVVVDDEDRENEGDLTLAAEKVTPEAINFMAKYGRGLVCLAMTEERLEHLNIGL